MSSVILITLNIPFLCKSNQIKKTEDVANITTKYIPVATFDKRKDDSSTLLNKVYLFGCSIKFTLN